jgi:hypothetical protein
MYNFHSHFPTSKQELFFLVLLLSPIFHKLTVPRTCTPLAQDPPSPDRCHRQTNLARHLPDRRAAGTEMTLGMIYDVLVTQELSILCR